MVRSDIRRGGGRRLRRSVVAALAALALAAAAAAPASAQDSRGDNFWLMFPGNLSGQELQLFIAGDARTTGTVEIPGLDFTQAFSVTPGSVTTVDLPPAAQQASSDTVENLGIHVTAEAEVTVYGLNREAATTDAFLGLPVDALGTEYVNLGYQGFGNQFGIVASEDETTVTITPTVETLGHPAGVPYTVRLSQGQTYLLRDDSSLDLSGSIISSTKPIAVFGGSQCANVPPTFGACDHLVEQLTPTSQWGQNFLSMPLATRANGDTFRILASEDKTTVQLNGSTVATLNRGQLHEQVIAEPARITADKPVLVMQYSNGESFDDFPEDDGNQDGDPFQMMIPPTEQYLPSYTVSTPAEGFSPNFINVIAPKSAVGSVEIDGTPIPAENFTAIGDSGFSGAQIPVEPGSHTVASRLPIGVHSYGFGFFDSYGYPGGLSLSEVARVENVSLTPERATNTVGTEHCVDALVTDQNGNPLLDIRVDFTVDGANTAFGFAFTGENGVARFCYVGSNAGDDEIRAAVGDLADTAAKTWTAQPDNTPPETNITGGPSGSTNATDASFSFESTEPASSFECSLDGAAFAPCSSPQSYSGLAPGDHSFRVQATDAARNLDLSPATRSWTITQPPPPPPPLDTLPPDTPITSGPPASGPDKTPSFVFISTEGDSRFECSVDGGPFVACSSPFTTGSWPPGSTRSRCGRSMRPATSTRRRASTCSRSRRPRSRSCPHRSRASM